MQNNRTDRLVCTIVVVPKKHGIRVCIDTRMLNRPIKRERYVLPTLKDIIQKVTGGKVWTSLDAACGYYNVCLHEDSQKLTTFMTPMGRYCFHRLPFGISLASEVFQRRIAEIMDGIDGFAVYQDDILVNGTAQAEHDPRLEKVFKHIKNSGIKLNRGKCTFRQRSLKYLGHIFYENGVHPDPEKFEAISRMKPPENIT